MKVASGAGVLTVRVSTQFWRELPSVGHLIVVLTTLNPALHSFASISLSQHRAVSVAEGDQAIEHGQWPLCDIGRER